MRTLHYSGNQPMTIGLCGERITSENTVTFRPYELDPVGRKNAGPYLNGTSACPLCFEALKQDRPQDLPSLRKSEPDPKAARSTFLERKREATKADLLLKFEDGDYHGVQDCASDLRDIESELKGLRWPE